ncbi:CusA/CzcA family heavy metal efflux RND transporter [Litoribacter ruber]|uniref:CusA/CzcA family heavy metal efflux RND transporter n=1 Tax=Litoribacter ruber TaxID=702568 RepID=UPI001BD92A81|nr:CusA/CzcA family heavy metal efflux RND transporter [Litoribacter ruber]MBT0809696.1 CusA/CzcA family heavy metal efflux RND transporter [Litoribacter ruber]
MIHQIIAFSVRNKLLIGLLTVAWIIAGVYSLTQVPMDAVPDVTNNQVQIITQAPNLGTEDIEQFITYPIEIALSNLPDVVEIRSISRFGLSLVTVVFEDRMGTYLPRQLISEKLEEVRRQIPEGFGDMEMGPISTGLGEIYQYSLEVDPEYRDRYDLTELRTIQDWIITRQMAMVPGVIEVNSFGGNIKQYEVAIDPDDLRSHGVTIADVFSALEANNQNTGGAYIEKNHMANFIRGEGLIRSMEDIEDIWLPTERDIPLQIKDVAEVRFGSAVRYGAFTQNGQGEAVGGIIFMLKGANSNQVIGDVKERMAQIQQSLPPGVHISPFLDRSQLIQETTGTIKTNLTEGALIVVFVLVFLLGNWRGGLIVASTIPLSLLFAFILMNVFDVWANLMSLGAIDFGIIVDGAVIIVEGSVFFMHQRIGQGQVLNQASRDRTVLKASSKMMNAAFFGQLIILIVFLPILFLEGIEGKMFQPMALTFMFAMLGAMILCLTYVPMVSALFLKVKEKEGHTWGDKVVYWTERNYGQLLDKVLTKGNVVLASATLLLGLAVFTFTRMGGEFIPQLDEGDIAFHILMRPGSTLEEGIAKSTEIEQLLLDNFPEIEKVLSRFGVAEVPTDPMPMDMADCFIILKPKSDWVSASNKEELIEKIEEVLEEVTGVNLEFSQPIEMRFNELISGVREDVAIKLYGEDLEILAAKSAEIGRLVENIPGVADLKVEATSGLPQISVQYDRGQLARYGVNVREINQAISSAFAGGKAGVVFEGERRFDLVLRLDAAKRQELADIEDLFIPTASGGQVPLTQLASISYQDGPMQISRDDTQRRTYVGINVRGRDIQSLVQEIDERLKQRLELPPGYFIRYGGAFENLERATARLKLVVPIALALIFFLIYLALGSFKQTAVIYVAIPMAAIGGVFSLWLRDMPFSISAGVGFIVLFGVAVLNGLVLISSWNELKKESDLDLENRIRIGAKRRIRPIMLTALTDILGFLPMALSRSAGAEVQQPLATVVIGGMVTATLLTLFILPILYRWTESSAALPGKRTALGCVLALLAFSLPAKAQQVNPISMEQAIQRALENYPQLEAAKMQVQQEEALKKTAWDLGTTTLFTAGDEVSRPDENVGVITPIGISQQDINIFGISPTLNAQKQRIALSEIELNLTELEIRREVQLAYADALVKQGYLQLFTELDSLYEGFEKAAKVRLEVQDISRLAYLAAQNQYKQMKLKKENARFDYAESLIRLNLWLFGENLFTPHGSDGFYEKPLHLEEDLSGHPLLRRAEGSVMLAEAERRRAQSAYLPKLQALYGPQTVGGQPSFYQYQFGLTMPLFFLPQKGRVEAARLESRIAQQSSLQTQLEISNQVARLEQQYRKWLSSWLFFKNETLPLAREQRRGALLAFREGEIDYVFMIQSLNESLQTELQAQEALSNLMQARYELEYFINPDLK